MPFQPFHGSLSAITRTLLRCVAILVCVVALLSALDWLQNQVTGDTAQMTALIAILAVYALLLAVPFMPGVEVGLALLMMRGAEVAPFVWMATFCGLSLAYMIGCRMPFGWIAATFRDVGLNRAAGLTDRIGAMPGAVRLHALQEHAPRWLRPLTRQSRYVALALLLNLPGNSVIGGGGGLALMAGLSRLFAPAATFLTFALAITPVPLLVWAFGPDLLPWTD